MLSIANAILLPTVLGFLVSNWLFIEGGIFLNLFLGFGLGMGLVTTQLFLLGLLSIPFKLKLVVSILIVEIIILLSFSRKVIFANIKILRAETREFWKEILTYKKVLFFFILLLFIWTVLKFIFVVFEASIWPIYAWDSWDNWSLMAKFFYFTKGIATKSSEYFLGKGYRTFLSYPLHNPLMQVWFAMCLGNFHEVYVKFWSSLYFISTISSVFWALKRESSIIIALIFAFFLSSVPLITYHAFTAYSDLPLAYYALASGICIWAYLRKSNDFKLLLLSGLFSAFCVWTKLEGSFFFIANFCVILFHGRKNFVAIFKKLLVFIIPSLVIVLPWTGLLLLNNISFGRGKELPSNFTLHFEVFPVIFEQLFLSANFSLIFPFFVIITILGRKSILRTDLKYLYFTLVFILSCFMMIYLTTNNFRWVLNLTAINRNILTVVPLMFYISALTMINSYSLPQLNRQVYT